MSVRHAGFLPNPRSSVYAATKAYVTSFSEALRAELQKTGDKRMRVVPRSCGNRIPAIRQAGRMKPDIGPKFIVVTVEQEVRECAAALEADRPLDQFRGSDEAADALARLMPMPVLRWVATNVTQVTRRCVATAWPAQVLTQASDGTSRARWQTPGE